MKTSLGIKIVSLVLLLMVHVCILGAFAPRMRSAASSAYKSQSWGTGPGVALSTANTTTTLPSRFEIGASKCWSVGTTSTTTGFYFIFTTPDTGAGEPDLLTSSVAVSIFIPPGYTRDFDMAASSVEARIATGTGTIVMHLVATQ